MIVLDASVLIAHLDAGDAWHERATALLLHVAAQPLVANALTVGEVLVGPARLDRLAVATAALDRLGVRAVELPAHAGPDLAEVRASTRLRMPDACVLLTAESCRAELATFDEHLAAAARRRGVVVHGDGTGMGPSR